MEEPLGASSGDPVMDSRAWFEDAPVPMCVEDFSAVKHRLNELLPGRRLSVLGSE